MSTSSVRDVTPMTPRSHSAAPRESEQPLARAPRIAPSRPPQINVAINEIAGAKSALSRKASSSATGQAAEIATFAQAATALQNRRRDAYPMTGALIERNFVDRLFAASNVRVDPEHTWLDEFDRSTFDGGWQYRGQPIRSTSLADLVRNGFAADVDWERISMNARAGVFVQDPKTGTRTQLQIDTPTLKRVVDDMHPLPAFQLQQLGDFWGQDSQAQEGLHQQSLLTSAQAWQASRALHASGRLSDPALAMIRQAAGFPEEPAGDMRSYALDIGGYRADDIAVLEQADGRSVLVMPGDPVMFREFPSAKALRTGLRKMAQDPATRAKLATHFSLPDWRDSYKAGVGSLLEMMGTQGASANIPILRDRAEISGDVFDWAARRQGQARLAEAQTLLETDGKFDAATRSYLDQRGAQLFAVPVTASAGSVRRQATPAQDDWLRSLNEALTSTNAAWWAPDSAMTTPTATGLRALPEERQRELAQRHFALDATERQLTALEPDLQASARTFMQAKLRQHFQFTGDPDQVMLVEYEPDHFSPDTFDPETGRPAIPNPNAKGVRKITPLSQLPIDSMPYAAFLDQTGDAAQPTGRFAVRAADDIAKRWTPGMSSLLPVKELAAVMRNRQDVDFESTLLKATDDFYRQHGAAKTVLAQQQALLTADLMLAEGKLSERDYQLARSGFGISPATGAPHGVPRAHVSTHEIDIDGRVSLDGLRIEDRNSKRTLLYLPGEETPIRAFDDRSAAVDWLMQMHQDPVATDRFVADHFSATNAKQGVSSVLHAHERTDVLGRERFLNTTADINNQPFAWLSQRQHAQLKIDLKEEITSPGDARTNWWLDALEKTPISFIPAAAKTLQAPTLAQRREGLQELGLETLAEVFLAGAKKAVVPALKGLSGVWKGVRRLANGVADGVDQRTGSALAMAAIDRWFKPPQRVNGQIGYPMGPVAGPRLTDTIEGTVLHPSPASAAGGTATAPGTRPKKRPAPLPGAGQIALRDIGHPPGAADPPRPGPSRASALPSSTSLRNDGVPNDGFVHSEGDTVGAPGAGHIALQQMGNGPVGTEPGATNGRRASVGAVAEDNGTRSTPGSRRQSAADVDLDPDPTPAQLARARQIIGSHGQTKIPAPPWLVKPDWLTDDYVQQSGLILPGGTTTADQMIALQQRTYANLVNRHIVRLAEAYEARMVPSEINALLEAQKAAQGEQKSLILSRWAQVNPSKPMTTLDLNAIDALKSKYPLFKQQAERAVARLNAFREKLQQDLATYLSENLRNNAVVRTRQLELQKKLDDAVQREIAGFNLFVSRTGGAIGAAGLLVGGGGVTAWIVREMNK